MANALPRVALSVRDGGDGRVHRIALVAWAVVWLVSVAGLITLVAIGPS